MPTGGQDENSAQSCPHRPIQPGVGISRPGAVIAAGDLPCAKGRPYHYGGHGIARTGLGNGAAQLLPDPDGLQNPRRIAEERPRGRRRRYQERVQVQIRLE
ncbi:hypothetical protein EMEDMD4_310021 [Sinorhizobium medicae]|uniref:Uncharacterized protein n=1 Tax=Sinorhizobium medicae TaxID=110321 RepID=A0A508X1R2_9HYPH|nr:hypothetical protein EMEDMD4_310021 [Sinorhizobium medicae]